MSIQKRLTNHPVSENIWEEYWMCEEINDRGVLIDESLVLSSIKINEKCRENYLKTLQNLTNLENPNSVSQLKDWLFNKDVDAPSLGKKEVKELLNNANDETVQEVLTLRQLISKSSIKKYEAMINSKCVDGRVRGMFLFYGANRTGRFSSKIVQLQNLPQNHLADLSLARTLVKEGNLDAVDMLYGDVPDTLSQLIRTAFIPSSGHKFIVSDFSAIEARVIAWLAHEDWRQEAFKNNEDIYCASASQMFHVPVEKHGVNSELRPKGKIAELALAFDEEIEETEFDLEEINECTDIAINCVSEIYERLKAEGKNPFIASEVLVDFSDVVPEGFGSSDIVIVIRWSWELCQCSCGSVYCFD